MPAVHLTNESRGVTWTLDLDRDALLPGQLTKARVHLEVGKDIEARGLVAALIATEQWQFRQRQGSGKNSRTVTVTEHEELRRVPVMLLGPTNLKAGEVRDFDFEMPVPPLGPASLDATVSALAWTLELKLDVPGGRDSSIVIPIRVLQPTALLRAGVVRVGQFALFGAAESATDGAKGTLELDPVPLCVGKPFTGRLTIETDKAQKVQEIRVEIRVKVTSTVPSGLEEEVTAWAGQVLGEAELPAGTRTIELAGELPPRDLPTIELPHGKTAATVHLILARAWKRDPHVVRDVAVCSTTEL
ncbi:MAG: hypothetical protein M3R57_12220 [Chloroflexota bacterium]|nr:hypothetical protein [Chloroflexota bacterium]